MLLWLSLLFKRRRSSPHNVESAGRLTCAFYNLQLFPSDDGESDATLGDLIAEDVEESLRHRLKCAVHEVLDKMEWTEQFALGSLMWKDRTAEYCAERLGVSRQAFITFRDEVAVPHFIALWESLDTRC